MKERSRLKSLKSAGTSRRTISAKNKGKTQNYFWIISIIFFLLAIGFLAMKNGMLTGNLNTISGEKTLTAKEAEQRLINFIDETYSKTVKGVEAIETKEESGIYAVTALITDQNDRTSTSTIYISRDGKYFLANAINIDEIKDKLAAQQTNNNKQAQPQTDIPKSDNPKVQLFTMSYCPYGNQAEKGISPVAKLLKDSVEVEPHYVIYSDYRGGGKQYCLDKENKYCSMHGIDELKQDVRELCIYKYNRSKFWDYIDAVDKDCTVSNIEECWDSPADKLGIDTEKISTCFDSEAMDMLAKEVDLDKKYNVTGSPALVINGARYQGGRSPEDYKMGICGAFNNQPEKCSESLGQTTAPTSGGCN